MNMSVLTEIIARNSAENESYSGTLTQLVAKQPFWTGCLNSLQPRANGYSQRTQLGVIQL